MNIILLFVLQAVSAISDLEHMSRCLPAVRTFIADGGGSVDWLFEKADDDADVVLLYMMRMCYFRHDREIESTRYDAKALFGRVTDRVESFTDHEFALLSEAVRQEVVSGKPYEELFNKPLSEESEWESGFQKILFVVPLIGVGLAALVARGLIRPKVPTKHD
jgi:hypothetical protein